MSAAGAMLPDGRVHLHHGPIDLVIGATGPGRAAALARAARRFRTVLEELAAELPLLRRPLGDWPAGPVARRMAHAVAPFGDVFVTPMAAVAGAVADEIADAMRGPGVTKIHVNNGGDIAFHLQGTESVTALSPAGEIRLTAADAGAVGGIATSGWRGRSHSLGIADAVTVLAASAAAADVAATLVANAVDLPGHPAIQRAPACALSPDSDLGERPVTTGRGALSAACAARALGRGARAAEAWRAQGLLHSACLTLDDTHRVVGPLPALAHALPA